MPSGLSQSHQEIAGQFQWECCAYTQRTYPNGHALGDRVPTASTGPSRPLLHMRLKAFAGPFGVCYQVVTRTTWQLVALSGPHLNSISLHKAAAAVAPSRATTRCPASLLASRRTYTARDLDGSFVRGTIPVLFTRCCSKTIRL